MSRWPYDPDTIKKGDIIPRAAVTQWTGCTPGSDAEKLAALRLREQVERDLAARNAPATVVLRADGIRVLTDAEAAEYNARRFRLASAARRRSHRRMAEVDASQLSQEDRVRLDRRLVVQAQLLQAERRELQRQRIREVAGEVAERMRRLKQG